jgi:DNA-directed RNA polymerase sigma subunit (sigma70/sigma32)
MKEDVLPEEEDAVRNGYEKLLNTVFESTRRNNEAAGVTLEPERFEEVRDIFLDIFALTLEEPTPPEVESLKQARWTENTLRPGEVYALILRFGLIQPHQDGETDEPSLKKIGEIMGGISRAAVSEYIKNAIKKLNHPDNFERLKQFLQ